MIEKYRLPELYQSSGSRCLVIAHRGASAYYPENTMAAFKGAVELGADMIELDVMLSNDGVPMVFHDAKLDTHSNGQGLFSYHTSDELKRLDAGSWLDPAFAGEGIPTLEEVLAFASGTIALNIEIKTEAVTDRLSGGVEEKCLQLVKNYGMESHVLFSSFDYRVARHLKALDPSIPVALLYSRSQSNRKKPSELVKTYRADAFNCSYKQLKKKWSQNLKQHQIPHFIYTVDRPDRMQKLLDAGVTGIFTNKPDLLKSIIDQSEH